MLLSSWQPSCGALSAVHHEPHHAGHTSSSLLKLEYSRRVAVVPSILVTL